METVRIKLTSQILQISIAKSWYMCPHLFIWSQEGDSNPQGQMTVGYEPTELPIVHILQYICWLIRNRTLIPSPLLLSSPAIVSLPLFRISLQVIVSQGDYVPIHHNQVREFRTSQPQINYFCDLYPIWDSNPGLLREREVTLTPCRMGHICLRAIGDSNPWSSTWQAEMLNPYTNSSFY